jgi:isoleucyl-tRNA synthetase
VPHEQLLEIDRYALARAAQLQAEIVGTFQAERKVFEGGHFGNYEFHPVVSKLQVYCSEDLGAFYLDILKDRLYTTAPGSLARRSAQTALWQITQAMLRWMAPFLSFTAEEAWQVLKLGETVFTETYVHLPAPDATLLDKWARIRAVREVANKEIEALRAAGQVGASLQAEIEVQANDADHAALTSLGDDLKFVFITSKVALSLAAETKVTPRPSQATKCERCWHYADDVGQHGHEGLCGRCVSNLHGSGETRRCA